jgi:hypothetical protein
VALQGDTMPSYAVTFEDSHSETLDAPTAIDAAKAAKRAYDSGEHRVLRAVLAGPNGEEG